jgi:hypothetical protein
MTGFAAQSSLIIQQYDDHDGTGAPSEFILAYKKPGVSEYYRVWLTIADGRCGASSVAIWWNDFEPCASRTQHLAHMALVNTTMHSTAVEHPQILDPDEVVHLKNSQSTWNWAPEHFRLVATAFQCHVNVFKFARPGGHLHVSAIVASSLFPLHSTSLRSLQSFLTHIIDTCSFLPACLRSCVLPSSFKHKQHTYTPSLTPIYMFVCG